MFQFDFLNDDFTKLPQSLQDIINDAEKSKKLVIYINPPYAEATASDTISGNLRHKAGVSANKTYNKYFSLLGRGINELFIQFLVRIFFEIPNCKIANFSTLKQLQSQNFSSFRNVFLAKLQSCFIVPASTFDNVKGSFPIGFFIWDTFEKVRFDSVQVDVFDKDESFIGNKTIRVVEKNGVILNWMQNFYDNQGDRLAYMVRGASDFQNNKIVFIDNSPSKAVIEHSQTHNITKKNLIPNCIFYTVRKVITATWLNDRDQFLYPNDGWQTDSEFQNDCLAFTLFSNNIQSKYGANHWIPFTEQEVNAKEKFASHFMTDFINGKLKVEQQAQNTLFENEAINAAQSNQGNQGNQPRQFSPEATAVFDAGRALWQYYHQQKGVNVNASYYDIRAYFQGRNAAGRMNAKSDDANYTALIGELRNTLNQLADKIKPKIFEYGFLKE